MNIQGDDADNSDDEFLQRLDEIDRELQKTNSRSKINMKSNSSHFPESSESKKKLPQDAMNDLFDSDDEWTADSPAVSSPIKSHSTPGPSFFDPRR